MTEIIAICDPQKDHNTPIVTLKARFTDPKVFLANVQEIDHMLVEGKFTTEERALINRRAVGKEESDEKNRLKSRMRKWRKKMYKTLFNEEMPTRKRNSSDTVSLPPLPQSPVSEIVEMDDIVAEMTSENASLKAALRQMEDTLLGHASTVMEFAALQEEMAYMEACNKDMMRRLVAMEGELEAANALADMSVRQLKAQREAIMIILGA